MCAVVYVLSNGRESDKKKGLWILGLAVMYGDLEFYLSVDNVGRGEAGD
jgi:hypothetical protein